MKHQIIDCKTSDIELAAYAPETPNEYAVQKLIDWRPHSCLRNFGQSKYAKNIKTFEMESTVSVSSTFLSCASLKVMYRDFSKTNFLVAN